MIERFASAANHRAASLLCASRVLPPLHARTWWQALSMALPAQDHCASGSVSRHRCYDRCSLLPLLVRRVPAQPSAAQPQRDPWAADGSPPKVSAQQLRMQGQLLATLPSTAQALQRLCAVLTWAGAARAGAGAAVRHRDATQRGQLCGRHRGGRDGRGAFRSAAAVAAPLHAPALCCGAASQHASRLGVPRLMPGRERGWALAEVCTEVWRSFAHRRGTAPVC